MKTVLADSSQPERDRNEALKWIVHLVGNLHQPLHAADNIYQAGKKDKEDNPDDRGGNDIAVTLRGSQAHKKLHGFLGHRVRQFFIRASCERSHAVAAEQGRLIGGHWFQIPPLQTNGTALAWTTQSDRLARTDVYKLPGFKCGQPEDAVVRFQRRT